MPATCGICRFFCPTKDAMSVMLQRPSKSTAGECRRYPPAMKVKLDFASGGAGVIVPDTVMIAYWPQIAALDWCGEFGPADQVPA